MAATLISFPSPCIPAHKGTEWRRMHFFWNRISCYCFWLHQWRWHGQPGPSFAEPPTATPPSKHNLLRWSAAGAGILQRGVSECALPGVCLCVCLCTCVCVCCSLSKCMCVCALSHQLHWSHNLRNILTKTHPGSDRLNDFKKVIPYGVMLLFYVLGRMDGSGGIWPRSRSRRGDTSARRSL